MCCVKYRPTATTVGPTTIVAISLLLYAVYYTYIIAFDHIFYPGCHIPDNSVLSGKPKDTRTSWNPTSFASLVSCDLFLDPGKKKKKATTHVIFLFLSSRFGAVPFLGEKISSHARENSATSWGSSSLLLSFLGDVFNIFLAFVVPSQPRLAAPNSSYYRVD